MGVITNAITGKKKRKIIPMGKNERWEAYDNKTSFYKVVRECSMNPNNVEVLADDEDIKNLREEIGETEVITIMPKQRGGNQ